MRGGDSLQFFELSNIRAAMRNLESDRPDIFLKDEARITEQPNEGGLLIQDQANLVVCSPVRGAPVYYNADSIFDESEPKWKVLDPTKLGSYTSYDDYKIDEASCRANFLKWQKKDSHKN